MFEEINAIKDSKQIGAKALRLKELVDKGFKIPAFVVIPSDTLVQINEDKTKEFNENFSKTTIFQKKFSLYAVRSAALAEDSQTKSYAGKFKTILKVDSNNLLGAVLKVKEDARQKLKSEGNFSIIIEEYIEPDYSGVIFSRGPLGGREMVVEYNRGNGESVVGGETVFKYSFLNKRNIPKNKHTQAIPVEKLAMIAGQIEDIYGWPQDIEWAVKNNEIYILQTRPITTISEEKWRGLKFIDREFKSMENYIFEQTSVSETFNQPKPLSYSILQALYKTNGPIDKVYKKIGCKYQSLKQFRLIGNELFIDKDKEVKALLPAFGYLKQKSQIPKFESFGGWLTSLNNSLRLQFLSLKPLTELENKIEFLLQTPLSSQKLKESWEFFLEHYATVYEVNLRSQKSMVVLERFLGNDFKYVSELLYVKENEIDTLEYDEEDYLGNSLAIDDLSAFKLVKFHKNDTSSVQFEKWWQSLPDWKKRGLEPHIKIARQYIVLREKARWVSVRLISSLRKSVIKFGADNFTSQQELVYFLTIDEIIQEDFNLNECLKRREKYEANKTMSMPRLIASYEFKDKETQLKNVGLSSGVATGVVVDIENINNKVGVKILYTEVLSPDIAEHLDKIKGIITKQGGLLSHMAIVAREAKVPVVVSSETFDLGSEVSINGLTGDITKIDSI